MEIKIYQIDAFTDKQFSGNPAIVCLLDKWPDKEILQRIAAENYVPETAFVVKVGKGYQLKWFTPVTEIDLCGHATLAAAFVIFQYLLSGITVIEFETLSGILSVSKEKALYTLEFPSRKAAITAPIANLELALGIPPDEVYLSRDILAIYKTETLIRSIQPNFEVMRNISAGMGIIVSAPGDTVDFVSRFFAPKVGILEDPVTGSAHCTLVPYWSERLKKSTLHARQISSRGGELFCEDDGSIVKISGSAVLYSKGTIYL